MRKNAFVIRVHTSGSTTFAEKQVVLDMTDERFAALEKKGLVREATEAEVKAASNAGEKQAEAPANKAAATPKNKAAGGSRGKKA